MTLLTAPAPLTELTGRARRAVTWLATQPGDYDPSSGRGPDWGKAAPVGLLIILLLGLALFFLIRSMNKNLRRVPASFDAPAADTAPDPAATTGTTTVQGPDEATGTTAATAARATPKDPPPIR